MNCNDIRPLISAYYDGEATPEEHANVASHLAGCEDCRRVMAEYRAIGGGMRALPVPVPPAGLRRNVWRAIEAQPRSAVLAANPKSKIAPSNAVKGQNPKLPAARPANPLARIGRSWGGAIPRAGLIAAVLVIFVGAILLIRNTASTQAAALRNASPSYTDPVLVEFSKYVKAPEAEKYTSVLRMEDGVSVAVTDVVKSYSHSDRLLTINPPNGRWAAGATYEVDVDAPSIHLDTGSGALAAQPMKLTFSLPALTATPTNTPVSTATAKPTHTPEPTAIAHVTQARNTPEPASTQPTQVTNVPTFQRSNVGTFTNTSTPTRTVEPSATPTASPTNAAGQEPTATPGHKGTHTPEPDVTATTTPGTPRPGPICSTTPVSGFGKLYNDNLAVRTRLGCPEDSETAIQEATQQQFQGGYMFWRGDTHIVLVFLNGAAGEGAWVSYDDTWRETDPTHAPATPPPGLYEPVRGFGKIWHTDAGLRQRLGWAIAPEAAITGAWQSFAHGSTLWTSDRYIRVLYDDGAWAGFVDTYATPTPVSSHPVGE